MTLIISLISLLPLRSQNPQQDDGEILSYHKIIVCEGMDSQNLFNNIQDAIYRIYDSASVHRSDDNQLLIDCDFKVYNSVIGKIGNPAGRIDFTLIMDVKDNKYRYTANKFYFTTIQRNRYGRFQLCDERPVLVNIYSTNKALLKKIKIQSEAYLEKLEEALLDYIALAENLKTDW